jgi:phage-related protein
LKDLGTPLITEKNRQYTEHPWIFLFEVEVGTGLDPWRFAAYPEPVPWNGYTWERMNAAVEMISQNSAGRLAGINVHVSNVALQVSAHQATYDLRGRDVSIYIINRRHLDVTTVINFTYRINNIQRSDTDALFELGHEDLFLLQLPHVRWIRDHCPYRYRDGNCRYPEDEFGKNTEQDLLLGGDSNKGGGWATENIGNAQIADINRTNAGKLTVQRTTGSWRFWNASRTAPQTYKLFQGDFQVYTRLSSSLTADSDAGFYAQSVDDLGDWICWMGREWDGVDYLVTRNTVNNVSDQISETQLKKMIRIDRIGSTIRMYAKADADADWTLYREEVRADFSSTLRVGFVFSVSAGDLAGEPETFDYFRALSGGLATCDYSFDGPNGCKVHMNEPNFGGAAGLPYGRINL